VGHGTGKSGYHNGSINAIITFGFTARRTPGGSLQYLCIPQNSTQFENGLRLNIQYPKVDEPRFKKTADGKPFYGDVKESILDNALPARGKEADIRLYTDANHAGDKVTQRS
jgi:hypothetical protein